MQRGRGVLLRRKAKFTRGGGVILTILILFGLCLVAIFGYFYFCRVLGMRETETARDLIAGAWDDFLRFIRIRR